VKDVKNGPDYPIEMKSHNFCIEGIGEWEISVPKTVYPPREDSELLGSVISIFEGRIGSALEIGCGSGAISILLAKLGWKVTSCDINPYAVAATKANLENAGLSENTLVIEAGVGFDLEIPEDVTLIVWNLPYLDPETTNDFEPVEGASMFDTEEGWGNALHTELSNQKWGLNQDSLVILLFRTDPISCSSPKYWRSRGWSTRSVASIRIGGERLEVFAMWRPGWDEGPVIIEECESTMDEFSLVEGKKWGRIIAKRQNSGRGRRGSVWNSSEDDLAASWVIDPGTIEWITPGILQTSIGAIVAEALDAYLKWPNDIISADGRKMGGILVETSSGDPMRIGIGLNKSDSKKSQDGIWKSGWNETLGDVGAREVFCLIDASISSFFEDRGFFKMPTNREMAEMSWKEMSKLISRGCSVEVEGVESRVVGLKMDGAIELLGEDGAFVIGDLDKVKWSFRGHECR